MNSRASGLTVFTWMLQRLAAAGLLKGKTVGVDATTLEGNAVLRSIVRRDTCVWSDFWTRWIAGTGGRSPHV